eukprot:TRINITY_DN6514_c0_g1_i1.p1 TRINITY_DN6514_c0_g1~~TRINITY_DN6514_c0_g1_i1.p1  ORF type:complete len:955 (+),score=148.57 TRINITY_DN6514_c0_g1_i1:163-2865(+)
MDLVIGDESVTYDKYEIASLLTMIHEGNRSLGGMKKIATAVALLGFMKFLNGYYMYFITEATQLGSIGRHKIFTVDQVSHIYLPNIKPQEHVAEEERYKGLFFGLDVTKDFFFSFTYDITRTLQHNMNPVNQTKTDHNPMFTWNRFLLQDLQELPGASGQDVNPWVVPVIHGYFIQARMDVYGSSIELTLISRRSSYFAGTRYLKRGTNEEGYVANDVETEQIICEPNTGQRIDEHFSSFVQHRGSIPLFWSQDNTGGVPKPPIDVLRKDPFFSSTILHFSDLMARYGHPITVLNLVKSYEKRPRESILGDGYQEAINFINNNITDPEYKIIYKPWDFKTASTKGNKKKSLSQISKISEDAIEKIGFFHSGPRVPSIVLREQRDPIRSKINVGGLSYDKNKMVGREQKGVVRTNCIDSLDRTNAAQYCVGQCALGHQLYALGLTQYPVHTFESNLSALLMSMYEKSGNQLALQYGGSGLAHTIQTFNTTNVFDVYTSIQRYYNNVFSDSEKQMSINLFLGVFQPSLHHYKGANFSDDFLEFYKKNELSSWYFRGIEKENPGFMSSVDSTTNSKDFMSLLARIPQSTQLHLDLWQLYTDYFLHTKYPIKKLFFREKWWLNPGIHNLMESKKNITPCLPPPSMGHRGGEFDTAHDNGDRYWAWDSQEELDRLTKISDDLEYSKQFYEFYGIYKLTEFDFELNLHFNDVIRLTDVPEAKDSLENAVPSSSYTVAPGSIANVSATNITMPRDDKLDANWEGGLWNVKQWLTFVSPANADQGTKTEQKKGKKTEKDGDKKDARKFKQDRDYNPLGAYGEVLEDRKDEFKSYFNLRDLSKEPSSTTKENYLRYMSTTHAAKPTFLVEVQETRRHFQDYIIESEELEDLSYKEEERRSKYLSFNIIS